MPVQDHVVEQNSTMLLEASKSLIPTVEIFKTLKKDLENRTGEIKYKTGIADLDYILWGLHKKELLVYGARTSQGKCLGKGTLILMYDGSYRLVECIKVGDKVMGVDSQPREVVDVCSGYDNMYKIKQLRGIDYVVNSEHILSLKQTGDVNYSKHNGKVTSSRYSKGTIVNIPIKAYLCKSQKFKHKHKGYKVGVEFKERGVPIDPYFFGLWLGDGTSSKPSITTIDEKIKDYIYNFAEKQGMFVREEKNTRSRATVYNIVGRLGKGGNKPNKLLDKLRKLGVAGNKHIPTCYKINSRKNRLALLAGLIDTDGYINTGLSMMFCNVNKILAEDVCWLARSVGYNASIKEYVAKIKRINYEVTAYKVYISSEDYSALPMLIDYKKPKGKLRTNPLTTGFEVEHMGVDEYYGFTLKGKDSLFILEDFTVTHNSCFAVHCARHLVDSNQSVLYFSLEMSKEQLLERFLSSICDIDANLLRTGKALSLVEEREKIFTKWLDNVNLWIDDTNGMHFEKIINIVKLTRPDFIIIDYVQMVSTKGFKDKLSAMEDFIKEIHNLGKKRNFGTILISQINRQGAERPYLENLKGAGMLEEHPDTVILAQWDWEKNEYTMWVEKQRHGTTGKLMVTFEPQYSRFTNDDTRIERKDWNG